MSRKHYGIALGSLLLVAGALPMAAHAGTAQGDKTSAEKGTSVAKGLGGATGGDRVMALVAPAGAVVRSKGVASVAHVGIGTYCITPSIAAAKPATLIPSVSVDFTATARVDAIVQFRSTNTTCPAGSFTVLTFDRLTGAAYALSDAVQFSFVAP